MDSQDDQVEWVDKDLEDDQDHQETKDHEETQDHQDPWDPLPPEVAPKDPIQKQPVLEQ